MCPVRGARRSPPSWPGTDRRRGEAAAGDALHEASGLEFNTLFPGDYGFWETINELVQQEPPEAGDPELLGLLAAVGLVHGKRFEPNERMRKIREEAVVGNATARPQFTGRLFTQSG